MPQKLALQRRDERLDGVVVLAEGHKRRIPGGESRLQTPHPGEPGVVVQAKRVQDVPDGQVGQDTLLQDLAGFGRTGSRLDELAQRPEQSGGQLIDTQNHRLRPVVADGPKQATVLGKREGLRKLAHDLPFAPLSYFATGSYHRPVPQCRNRPGNEVRDHVQTHHIFRTPVQDLPEVLAHAVQEPVVHLVPAAQGEELQLLQPSLQETKPRLLQSRSGPAQLGFVETLTFANVVQNPRSLVHGQVAKSFRQVALEGAELPACQDAFQRGPRSFRRFLLRVVQVLGQSLPRSSRSHHGR